MFIGHYGLAYVVKKKEEKIPLWMLFTAVQLLDLIAFTFVLLGIENASYQPSDNPFFRNLLVLPYSHSLLGALIISTMVFLAFWAKGKKRWAWVLSLCVLSHWFIDLIVHTQDLPVLFGTHNVGFGLWNYPLVTYAAEVLFVIIGWLLVKQRNVFSYILLFLMIALFTGMLFSEEPEIMKTNDYLRTSVVLISNGLFIFIAYLSDKKRKEKKRNIIMSKKHEKMMTDLQRLLDTQDFQSEEELKNFLDGLMGQPLPTFSENALTNEEKAQDLVYEAYELSPAKAKKNIEKALELNPNSIEAYEFLGNTAKQIEVARKYYEKGIEIGRKLFLEENAKEYLGHFWLIHETRPFMRCLHSYSAILYAQGKKKECISVLEEMILLNPNDNQGVRDTLMLYLLEADEFEKFDYFVHMYKEDEMSFMLYNQALFAFKKESDTKNAQKKLKKAVKQNKHTAQKLIAGKEINSYPSYYGIGDEDEADIYIYSALPIWKKTNGAIDWLNSHVK